MNTQQSIQDAEQRKREFSALRKYAAIQKSQEDKVCVQKAYIDIAGDIEAAFVLDELLFFTLPRPETGKSGLRVWKEGFLWMAVGREDWWERKRLTARQADLATEKLIEKKLVFKEVHKFNGLNTVHLRLNVEEFFKAYTQILDKANPPEDGEDTIIKDIADLYEMMGESRLPNGGLPNGDGRLPNGEMVSPNGDFLNNPHTSLTQPDVSLSEKKRKPQKKGDLVDGILFFSKKAKGEEEVEEMLVRLEKGLNVNLQRSLNNQTFAKKIIKAETGGQPLSDFMRWLKSDEWRLAHLYIYADLSKLWQIWPQAFVKTESIEYKKVVADEDDEKGVPNPFGRPKGLRPVVRPDRAGSQSTVE